MAAVLCLDNEEEATEKGKLRTLGGSDLREQFCWGERLEVRTGRDFLQSTGTRRGYKKQPHSNVHCNVQKIESLTTDLPKVKL